MTTVKTLSWSTMDVESVLWILLALYMFVVEPTWSSLSVLCGSFFTALQEPQYSSTWRGSGCCMSAVLVPILLKSMAIYNERWLPYYKLASFLWTQERTSMAVIAVALVAMIDTDLEDTRTMLVLFLYLTIFHSIQAYPSLHKVFTKGEWTLLTSLASIAVVEWDTHMPQHNYVALSGVLGCVVACATTTHILNPCIRGGLLVTIPLMTVEGALWYCDNVHAATWLVTFLLAPEESSQYPRAVWLVYWLAVVTVALLQAPQQCSVVISRKWFHLVAIALFLPVTLAAPQLMSLSYAIALCVLIVVESMRCYLPTIVQEYYGRYVDPLKEDKDKVVISHISLILGCAMPLWIHECTSRPTLFFGILVLGVGDSLAAVVGIQFGRRKWPKCRKTIEGSVAMWMGMAVCCFPLQNWVAAVTFTTLLEAFTTQIDNLILPLAGATVLLLQS